MTAPQPDHTTDATRSRSATAGSESRYVDEACLTVVDGRRATRALVTWCKRLAISASEFEVLWCIRFTGGHGIDQATIASRLLLSPAQVSATVERLRSSGLIAQRSLAHDRRRHLWQLSAEGEALVERMLVEVASLRSEVTEAGKPAVVSPPARKEAA